MTAAQIAGPGLLPGHCEPFDRLRAVRGDIAFTELRSEMRHYFSGNKIVFHDQCVHFSPIHKRPVSQFRAIRRCFGLKVVSDRRTEISKQDDIDV